MSSTGLMAPYRPLTVRATWTLALALALVAAGGACSSRENENASGQGGNALTGGSANHGGANAGGGSAGAVSQAGSAAAGVHSVAGASFAGGTSAGGSASGAAGSSGESGAASVGGASSTNCDEGCVPLCEGGVCTCSCPTTPLTCANAAQPNETSFSSACAIDGDCFGAEHYIGCCLVSVVGLNASQRVGFTQWETDACKSPPVCGCAVDRLTTDDGKMIGRDMSYAVRCVAGKCASWIP